MSYDTAKPFIPKLPFSGGYVDNTPESSLSDNFSPFLKNARLDGTAIIKRPGHTLFGTLTSGDYPRGLGSYKRVVVSNDRIIIRHNKSGTQKIAIIDELGNITDITTGVLISSNNNMTFLNISDVIYCMNGSDNFGKLNGTTYTTPVTGIANFAPSFGVSFNGSHFASGWSTNANIVYKSVGNNYEDFGGTGSDTFSFQETITGLATNNQALFYFTKNTISVTGVGDIQNVSGTVNYITRPLQVEEGAINHNSIVSAGSNIYFLSPSNKLIRLARGQNIDGFEVYELSERKYSGISKLMSSLDLDQTNSFGYFLPKEHLIKWFVRSKGATFNDVCIIYDIIKNAFLIDSNKNFNGGISFKGKNYTISNIEPVIYQDEIGTDDEDSPIGFRYETKYFDLGIPTRKKELWETRTFTAINKLAKLSQEVVIDGNVIDTKIINSNNIPISSGGIGTTAIGTFGVGTGGITGIDNLVNVDIIRTKGNLQVKGKKIKFIFTDNELSSKIRLENIEMLIEVLPSITNNLTA